MLSSTKQFSRLSLSVLPPLRSLRALAICAAVVLAAFGAVEHYSAGAAPFGQQSAESGYRFVYMNRERLSDLKVSLLERLYNTRIPDGRYWYDRVSGAAGFEGAPTAVIIHPGLDIGGKLRSDASRGNTGVFVNGRELPWADVAGLQQLIPVYRIRYWIDASGNIGREGYPAAFNLVLLAQQAGLIGSGSGGGGARRGSILSGMYDSGIGSVIGGGDFFISGNSSASRW